jgi:uncharacterized protein (UPF0261 family)
MWFGTRESKLVSPPVTVGVLCTLDSKHATAAFVCDVLRAAGVAPKLIDLSLRPHANDRPDAVSGAAVAAAAGTTSDALARLSRAEAAQTMIGGGIAVAQSMLASGLAGMLGVGGANGATMACAIMRALPYGMPKVMITPVAATAAVQWYVAASDIAMFPTIGDISLNRVTRIAIANGAEALAGMAKAYRQRPARAPDSARLIGLSTFGNLQPAVDRITERLQQQALEVIHFHASGPGGRALEALAAAGELAGVIDLTTSELTDHVTGGVYSAGPDRLTAASAAGVPQVVVPGCLDFTNWWVGAVPERYRGRGFHQYNVEILLMRTNAEEFALLGDLMGERLARAEGPVSVLIPSGGFSQLTGRTMRSLEGEELGPWAQPETDAVFAAALRRHLRNEMIMELPHHINDPAFADACVDELRRLMTSAKGIPAGRAP